MWCSSSNFLNYFPGFHCDMPDLRGTGHEKIILQKKGRCTSCNKFYSFSETGEHLCKECNGSMARGRRTRFNIVHQGKEITAAAKTRLNPTVLRKIIEENNALGENDDRWICPGCLALGNSVCCDGCNRWYHNFCVGIDNEAELGEFWLCPLCEPVEEGQVTVTKSEAVSVPLGSLRDPAEFTEEAYPTPLSAPVPKAVPRSRRRPKGVPKSRRSLRIRGEQPPVPSSSTDDLPFLAPLPASRETFGSAADIEGLILEPSEGADVTQKQPTPSKRKRAVSKHTLRHARKYQLATESPWIPSSVERVGSSRTVSATSDGSDESERIRMMRSRTGSGIHVFEESTELLEEPERKMQRRSPRGTDEPIFETEEKTEISSEEPSKKEE